ncbi:kinase-like protein [Trametes versicolor FP-101664 SS1]|uniref:kinase-like protein n=1 Tax=Trametes versicolor (strain FP-101664) TaxID=717944 RepID=UPI0004622D99|nr:kinase-like protein [Trametes versicolor FP-101664 SS1]EIW57257.1 kinase-like protein [Trametes versicolor FP-101664 SS1]
MGNVACCCSEPINFDGDVDLYHFNLHRAVGKGAFGKVRVVEHKKSKKLYALKYMEKAKCIKQKAVANIIQERRLLEEVDHPFVVNLRYAFQDDENCFFVLDLMLGGDLRFHLERLKYIPEEVVRFWMAELSCALEYLHRQRIMHRDLKPDNILLDAMGHAHITDFNVAIHYSERRLHTSVAGSMAYMAPEVIGRMGYTWCADWWSLGVVAWELLFHRRPFDGRSSEKMKHSILKDQVRLPSNAKEKCSKEGQRFLLSLLDRNPKTRLACKDLESGIEEVRNHPWMAGIDWDSLENKDVQPPFVPDMKKANFDVSHELDEFLMVEKPLTHQKRKQLHPDLEKMKPELRQLEEQFTLYDFSKNRRMSYYPHNQPITSVGHDEAEPSEVLPSTTNTLLPTGTMIDRSQAGSPINEDVGRYTHPPIPSLAGHGSEDSQS